MTEDSIPTDETRSTCANCGAVLDGEFCSQCGQSRDDIKRPFWSLAKDTLDGMLTWDGRLLTTLRQLYTRPGKVARDYADGKRAGFTPPVRLYLIVSLVFFAAMTVSGVRIVAVDVSMTETGPGINIQMFQPRGTSVPLRLDDEDRAQAHATGEEVGIAPRWIDLALYAAEHPREIEDKAAAAANQALILMVLVFVLMNMMLHPRARIIEHTIHALYYHAAFLPAAGAILIIAVNLHLPLMAALIVIISAAIGSMIAYYLFERGFYNSSWWGAILRTVLVSLVYSFATILAGIGLILLATM